MRLFDRTLTTLESALDARLQRQNVLASNVANADTPNYMPQDVDFSRALSHAQRQNEVVRDPNLKPGDLPLEVTPLAGLPNDVIVDGEAGAPSLDGNRVDLDRTMASLAENALQYGANTRSVAKKLALLRFVASDGQA
jgi:flagellar basal-body rod protein FlgB